jgi:glycyl-tRNA synthetase
MRGGTFSAAASRALKGVKRMEQREKTLDMIVNLCKNRGFIYPGSEIYGGLANSWDYGPLGVEFKNNVKRAWMKKVRAGKPLQRGLDAAILMNPQTWVTTGHVGNFSDPLIDCKRLQEPPSRRQPDRGWTGAPSRRMADGMTFDQMDAYHRLPRAIRSPARPAASMISRPSASST